MHVGTPKTVLKPAWFDAFFILRPTLFFPSWTFFLAGYHKGAGTHPAPYLLWIAAALGASFLLNQLADRREDRINEKLLPRWEGLITERMIHAELALLIAAVIAGGCWAGVEITALLALFFLIAGVLYNFPPFRLKGRPVGGIVSCAVGIWIGFLIGARAAEVAYPEALLAGLPYALAGAAVSLLTHVPDLDGDRLSGARTFPLVYGLRNTGAWAVILVVAAASTAFAVRDGYLLAASLISLPFFIAFFIKNTAQRADFAVKIAVFSLAVLIGLTWLPFWFLMAGYYLFARWYHRRRLGLDYPSFRPGAAKTPEQPA